MKKAVVAFILITIILTSAFAGLSADVGVGPLSKIGISYETGRFSFEAGYETTFPVGSVAMSKLMPKLVGDKLTSREYFSYGSKIYNGLDAGAYYQINNNGKNRFYAGFDFKFAKLTDDRRVGLFNLEFDNVYNMLVAAINLQMEYKHSFDQHNGLFAHVGFPLAFLMHTYPEGEYQYPATMIQTSYVLYEASKYIDIDHAAAVLYGAFTAATVQIGYSYTF